MTAIIPKYVDIPGYGRVRFPKALQGKEVSNREYKRLWRKYVTPHIPKLLRTATVIIAAILIACREPAAPPPKSCVPTGHPDSTKVLLDSAGNALITISWCGPITVE